MGRCSIRQIGDSLPSSNIDICSKASGGSHVWTQAPFPRMLCGCHCWTLPPMAHLVPPRLLCALWSPSTAARSCTCQTTGTLYFWPLAAAPHAPRSMVLVAAAKAVHCSGCSASFASGLSQCSVPGGISASEAASEPPGVRPTSPQFARDCSTAGICCRIHHHCHPAAT